MTLMQKNLRAHQKTMVAGIYDAWRAGARTVMATLATGGGKTPIKARIASEVQGPGIIQAHRGELVGQISDALADEGFRHNIIASDKVIRAIVEGQMKEFGKSFYDPRAAWSVASTDTIAKNGIPNADRIHW